MSDRSHWLDAPDGSVAGEVVPQPGAAIGDDGYQPGVRRIDAGETGEAAGSPARDQTASRCEKE